MKLGKTANLTPWMVILAILALASPARAGTTITVGPGGGYDYSTIKQAINAASNGDTVVVADGNYTGTNNKNLNFNGKAITVQSENGPANCIIDCEGNGRGFTFNSGEGADSVVDGFTIRNGDVVSGGGIYFIGKSNPTITNCIISGNTGKYGGGIHCWDSDPNITNCTIT